MTLQIQDWEIGTEQLQVEGQYQIVLVYQSARQSGEQVFVYEQQIPMATTLAIPEGLHTLNGIMPYYQSLTAQQMDERRIQLLGSGVFCTFPADCRQMTTEDEKQNKSNEIRQAKKEDDAMVEAAGQHMSYASSPSVVNKRGSRRANLSKYMRDLNSSVETPTSVRNFEISTDHE